ncbi:hypothetical protein V7112_20440 [Bacillus sp. JJ1566]|uniref:hypothetical protein n=1 Tax=Bacillus sp. JJ1566 TaxID=3122961 RepID=UPI002FFF1005
MASFAERDAFIHTGTGLEGCTDSVAEALENEMVLIVNVTEKVNLIGSEEGEEDHEEGHSCHIEYKLI